MSDETPIQIAVHRCGGIVWRNNSGAARDATGRPVRYGLANTSAKLNEVFKSSDYVGMMPDGRFLAIEIKPKGWFYRGDAHERAQLNFINEVKRRGGVAGFVTCAEDVFDLMKSR